MSTPDTITHQDKLLTVDTNAGGSQRTAPPRHQHLSAVLDPLANGVWVIRVKFAPGVTLPLHFHTGTVHAYTMSGCWYYTEHPGQKQTAGMYLFNRAARCTRSTRQPTTPWTPTSSSW